MADTGGAAGASGATSSAQASRAAGAGSSARALVPAGPQFAKIDDEDLNRLILSIQQDAGAREQHLIALAKITEHKDDDAIRRRVGATGVIVNLVDFVKPTNSPSLLANLLTVLIHLTRSKENRDRVREAPGGFMMKLVNLLKMSRHLLKNSLIKQKTIQLTINLATSNPQNKALLQQGGAAAVIAKMLVEQDYVLSDDMTRFTVLAINVICTPNMDKEHKALVVKNKGLEGLILAVSATSPAIQRLALGTIESLATGCAPVKDRFRELEGIVLLVHLLATATEHIEDQAPEVAALASCLAKLCAASQNNCIATRAEGTLGILMGILATNKDSEVRDIKLSRLHASTCIMHMTKFDGNCRWVMRDSGYVSLIVEQLALNDFPLTEKCVWTLNNLCSKNDKDNQDEIVEQGGVVALVKVMEQKEVVEQRHPGIMKGTLATMIHLCETQKNTEALIDEGAVVVVLYHALALIRVNELAPEVDLAILTLRFLSNNNKRAQRIIRHIGGVELMLCVQEANLSSASIPEPPAETKYKLELELGKIRLLPPQHVPAPPAPLPAELQSDSDIQPLALLPSQEGKAPVTDGGTLALMVHGKRAQPKPKTPEEKAEEDDDEEAVKPKGDGQLLALPAPPAAAQEERGPMGEIVPADQAGAIVPVPEMGMVVAPPTTAVSSPMTTPSQSVAATPRVSKQLLLADSAQPADAPSQPQPPNVQSEDGAGAAAPGFLIAPYVDLDRGADGRARAVEGREPEEEKLYQADLKARLKKRADRDYGYLVHDVEMGWFKEEVMRREVEAELERKKKHEEAMAKAAEEERVRVEAEARAKAEAEARAKAEAEEREARRLAQEKARVRAAMRGMVEDCVMLAAAEGEAMLGLARAKAIKDAMLQTQVKAELTAKDPATYKDLAVLKAAADKVKKYNVYIKERWEELLTCAQNLSLETEQTEQWQMGPLFAVEQLQLVLAEAKPVIPASDATLEQVMGALGIKEAIVSLCGEVVESMLEDGVACAELMYDLVGEAVEAAEAEKARKAEEARKAAELAKRMEIARLQALEMLASSLVYEVCDVAVGEVEARRDAARAAEKARVEAEKKAIQDREDAIKACAHRIAPNVPIELINPDTLLTAAVLKNDEDGVVALAPVAKVQQYTTGGYSLLHEAAELGSQVMVEVLLKHGAETEARTDRDSTPLISAALKGHTGAVQALLAAGADPRVRNKMGVSPLHAAVRSGNGDTCKALLEGGASFSELDADGNTTLHVAACLQDAGCVKAIVDFAVEIELSANSPDGKKTGGGFEGERNNLEGTIPMSPGGKDGSGGVVALSSSQGLVGLDSYHKAGPTIGNHTTKAMRRTLAVPVCSAFRLKNKHNITGLHLAAAAGNAEAVEYMLQRGAPLDPQDKKLYTPLHLAAYRGHVKCVSLLLAAGASTWIKTSEGLSVRDLACGPSSNVHTRRVINFACGVPEVQGEEWGIVDGGLTDVVAT